MRTIFAAACALALAASGFAAHAQQITFPAPAFRGGNVDWQVVLSTQQDRSVTLRLKVPQADAPLKGGLKHREVAAGEYRLAGAIEVSVAEKTELTVKIAPVPLGKPCKLSDGSMGDAYGRFTYSIEVIAAKSRPVSTKATHQPWPASWSGCGNFTLD